MTDEIHRVTTWSMVDEHGETWTVIDEVHVFPSEAALAERVAAARTLAAPAERAPRFP